MAKLYSLEYESVMKGIEAQRLRNQLEDLNVNSAKLPKSAVIEFKNLAADPKHLKECAGIAIANGLTVQEIKDFVGQIVGQKTDDKKAGIVANWRKIIKTPRGRGDNNRHRARFMTTIANFHQFLKAGHNGGPFLSLKDLGIELEADKKNVLADWRSVKQIVDNLFKGDK